MIWIFISGLILMLGLWSPAAGGTNPPALDSLIRSAVQKNPGLMAAQNRRESSLYQSRAAGTLPDPQVMLGFNNVPRSSWALDESMMSSISVGLSQALPWPGMLRAESRMASLEADLMNQETIMTRNRLIRQVKQSYYEYSFWTLARDIIGRNQELNESIKNVAEIRYTHGETSVQDFLRAHTAQTLLDNTLLEAQKNRLAALLQLARLTGSVVDSSLEPDLPEMPKEIISIDTDSLPGNNPDLARAGLEVNLARQKLALARSRYWPELMLRIEYMIRRDTEMDPLRGEDMISVGLGFNLPLWFSARQKNETRSARLAMESSRYRQHDLELMVQNELSTLLVQLKTLAGQNANFRDKLVPQAQAAFEAARSAYEVGQADFGDLVMSRIELLESEMNRLMNLKEYHQMTAEVEEIIGQNSEDLP